MVEQMTKAVKDLLNEFYDVYSAFSTSSTPSMYSESGLSDSYSGASSSQLRLIWWMLLVVKVMTLFKLLDLSLDMPRWFLFGMRVEE